MVLFKTAPQYAKPLRTTTADLVAASVTIGGSTITPSGAQAIADRVLDTYYMQNSQIEGTPIGITFPATAAFTNLTTGSSKGIGYPVTFYGNQIGTSAAWDPRNAVWQVKSGGQPNGGLQSDNLLLQGNTLRAVNANGQGPIYLSPQTNVVIPSTTYLKFDGSDSDSGTGIFADLSGALHFASSKCIKLEPQIAVTIPTGKPLLFDGQCYVDGVTYRSGIVNDAATSKLIVGGQTAVSLSTPPSGSVNISTIGVPLVFGPNNAFPSASANSGGDQLTFMANGQVNLTSPNVLIPATGRLSWGIMPNQTYIDATQGFRMVNTMGDVSLSANGHLNLGPASDVIIPGNQQLIWQTINSMIGPDAQGRLAIATKSAPIVLDSGTAQNIIINGSQPTINLGTTGNQISSSPTNITISTPKTTGDSIVVASPEIILQGNVVIQGSTTTIKSTTVQAEDPVIELGVGLSTGNVQDRGHISIYGNSNIAYWGYQPKTSAFAFIEKATDDGTGHYIGTLGSIQAASLQLSTGVISALPQTGPISINASSLNLTNNIPLYLNPLLSAGIQYNTSVGTVQLVGTNGLTFTGGASILSTDQALLRLNAANVKVDQNVLSFGAGPTLTASSTALTATNLTALNLPSSSTVNLGSIALTANETTKQFTIQADKSIILQTTEVIGPAKWRASVIDLQYGGTGNASWTIEGGIVYVDTIANQMKQSSAFIYNQTTSTMQLSLSTQGSMMTPPTTVTASLNATGISLQSQTQMFSFTNGLYCFGSTPSTPRLATKSSLYLDAMFTANLNGRVYYDDSIKTYVQGHSDTGILDLFGASIRIAQSTLQASDTSTPLSIISPINLSSDANGRIIWGNTSLSYSSSQQRLILAGSGLQLPTGPSNGLLWAGGNGWFEDGTGLNFQGTSLNIPTGSQISFNGGVTLTNTTWSSDNPLRLQIPQVIIDGNLRILGTTTEIVSQTSILDDQFIQIGRGRLLQISAVVNGATAKSVMITTTETHSLNVNDSIQLINLDCTPDIEGSYTVLSIQNTTQFTVQAATLTTRGTQGTVRAPEVIDPALDVGIQLERFGTSAFIFFQHATEQFVFYSNATNQNDIIKEGTLAALQCQLLNTKQLSGCALTGPFETFHHLVSGSNFEITGGKISTVSLDAWTTSTTSIIVNLNADYVDGHHATDFVFRDGSLQLTADWLASNTYKISSGKLNAANLAVSNFPYSNLVFSDSTGTLISDTASSAPGLRYTYYDTTRHLLVTSIDVSNLDNDIQFRDQQIPGGKVGPGLASCDITGNAGTVTNGVYTTQYLTPNAVLVSSPTNDSLESIQIPEGTFLGNINGKVGAYTAADLRTFLGPFRTIEIIYASPTGVTPQTQADVLVEITKLKIPDRSTTGITQAAIYTATLPAGIMEGQTKTIRSYITTPGDTIQVYLQMVTPDLSGRVGSVYLKFVNSGQSATFQWDADLQAWYQNSSGMDIFAIE